MSDSKSEKSKAVRANDASTSRESTKKLFEERGSYRACLVEDKWEEIRRKSIEKANKV